MNLNNYLKEKGIEITNGEGSLTEVGVFLVSCIAIALIKYIMEELINESNL